MHLYRKKIIFSIVCIILICCSSCKSADYGENINKEKKYSISDDIVIDNSNDGDSDFAMPNHIEDEFLRNNITIIISADVEGKDIDDLNVLSLSFDESNIENMFNKWFVLKFPDSKEAPDESVYKRWIEESEDGYIAVFNICRDGGITFFDGNKDINGTSVEDEHLFEYGYITKDIPLGMEIDAVQAEEATVEFIARYTPFGYKAYNIRVENDEQNNIGYYDISLQTEMDGIPICVVTGGESNLFPMEFHAFYSSNGIFSFQGNVNLKVDRRTPINRILPFEDVVNNYLDDVSVIATGDSIEVYRICLEYVPEISYSDDICVTLTPAWCFYYRDSRVENGKEISLNFTAAYSLESGCLIGRFN